MASKVTTTTRKATTNSKAKANPADVLAGIRERNTADAFDAAGTIREIMDAEFAATTASTALGERLADSPRVAAEVYGVRGAQSQIATLISGAKSGAAHNAAEQAIGRIVKCGRVLAAHPTLDALAVYAATNRMTGEQVDAVVAAKDADAAAKVLAGAKAAAKDKGKDKGKGPKQPKQPKVRTLHETVVDASKANADVAKKAKDLVGTDPATVATELDLHLQTLEAHMKAIRVMRDGAKAEVARRADAK